MPCWTRQPWPHNLNQTVSGKAGAVQGASILVVTPCPPVLGGSIKRDWTEVPDYVQTCRTTREAVMILVNSERVNSLVLASAWTDLVTLASHDGTLPPNASGLDMIDGGLSEILDQLPSSTTAVLAGQFPEVPGDPVPCSVGLPRLACDEMWQGMHSTYVTQLAPIDRLLEEITDRYPTRARLILPSEALCDATACMHELHGDPLYRDGGHIRRNLSLPVILELARMLKLPEALSR